MAQTDLRRSSRPARHSRIHGPRCLYGPRGTYDAYDKFGKCGPDSTRGFTLIELLVALTVLSLVAVLSWRGLEGMVRTQSQVQTRADEVMALQVGLAQWRTDLDAIVSLPGLPAVEWNGQVLRMIRRTEGPAGPAVSVVAWTRRSDEGTSRWRRWQSLPTTERGEVQAAWAQADIWARNPGATERAREVALLPLDDWEIFFYRDDAWVHPQSSDAPSATEGAPLPGGGEPPKRSADASTRLPEGLRVILRLPANAAIPGTLTLDWVNPRVGGGRS